MKIKINESYANQFVTTMKGFTINKDEVKEMDNEDNELRYYLEQKILVVVKEEENITKKIIKNDIPKKTIKEVVNKENNVDEVISGIIS